MKKVSEDSFITRDSIIDFNHTLLIILNAIALLRQQTQLVQQTLVLSLNLINVKTNNNRDVFESDFSHYIRDLISPAN